MDYLIINSEKKKLILYFYDFVKHFISSVLTHNADIGDFVE